MFGVEVGVYPNRSMSVVRPNPNIEDITKDLRSCSVGTIFVICTLCKNFGTAILKEDVKREERTTTLEPVCWIFSTIGTVWFHVSTC